MIVFHSTPVFLSLLLLAAHFSRAGNTLMVVVALVAPLLLLVRRRWVARAFQVALIIGALEWVRTLVEIAARRQRLGEPWMRMAIILAAVALFTGLSGLVFQTSRLKRRYAMGQ